MERLSELLRKFSENEPREPDGAAGTPKVYLYFGLYFDCYFKTQVAINPPLTPPKRGIILHNQESPSWEGRVYTFPLN